MTTHSSRKGIYLRLVLTMFFWGGTFVAGRALATEVSPYTAAAARFVLAACVLLVIIYLREGGLPGLTGRQWCSMTLLGFSGVFCYNLFFFKGLQTVEAGRGAMITGSIPAVVTILAVFFLGERFDKAKSFGIVLAISGALTVISHGSLASLFQGEIGSGELFLTGCVLSWAIYSLIGKIMLVHISPLVAVTYSCSIGAVLLLVVAIANGAAGEIRQLSVGGFMSIIYLALFGTAVGFSWFYEGVQALGAARAALFVNLVPVSGVLLGILLLGEKPDRSLYVGGLLVLAGLILINRPGRRPLHEKK